jgi:uncharacterized protein (TIGR02646 family)
MRPVDKGPAVRHYAKYQDAKQDLVNRLGSYCCYCERRIATLLAVEHIQPKGLLQYEHLETEWTNFLLACVNCNSAKVNQPVEPDQIILPDRDNTFLAFDYLVTGEVQVRNGLNANLPALATALLNLTALNRYEHQNWDEDVVFSALERLGQRVQAWDQALEARAAYEAGETSARSVAREASGAGFFSIWMAAFEGIPAVRAELITIFPNTAADCFDDETNTITPRPNNGLAHGGKI